MDLHHKVALVTGGALRVGRAIVLELARAGCRTAIHYRSSRDEALRLANAIAADGGEAATFAGDLNDPQTWQRLIAEVVERFGRLDVLVNNASAFLSDASDTIDRFDLAHWERMLRLNLIAPAGLCHHARPHLAANRCGRIINLCDISVERPWSEHLAYCASKAALVCLTRALAKALAPDVTVNGVSPGIAIFPDSYPQEQRDRLTARVPLRRAGTPEDIARAVRFLAESGDYVTGQILNVDGGRSVV